MDDDPSVVVQKVTSSNIGEPVSVVYGFMALSIIISLLTLVLLLAIGMIGMMRMLWRTRNRTP